ncbi:hypothetical protein FHS31_001856 [Sphingomonas vulcanisoli]|uniref:DUF4154 domain-containing protein n=1 Tax=Sphingomonas vulcanisoli TaxID=1658060 RepID=A0ABX0TVQ0_9SPHN|nr:hypothetical protein [Sphingomonas vulcanisoli]
MIGFVQSPPIGLVVAAIVYEPGNAASEAEAAAIETEIGAGLTVGRATIKARRVSVNALGGLAGVKVAFVTSGVHAQQALAEAAAHDGILTITGDTACVQAGRCVVAVSAAPRTQIIVSRAAAAASGIHFGSAFLMLIKEI